MPTYLVVVPQSPPVEVVAETVQVTAACALVLYGATLSDTVAAFNQGQWISIVDKAVTQAS